MIRLLFIFIFFLLSNCNVERLEKNHGNSLLFEKEKKLLLKKTNKNDIIDLLGPPSSESYFNNDVWIYIETKKTSGSIFKLGKKKFIKNNVLYLEIDNRGILKDKKLYTLNDKNKLLFSEDTTKSTDKDTFVYGVVSSLRQKIDSPKNKRNKKD